MSRQAGSFTRVHAIRTYAALGRRLNAFVVASARADGGRPSRQEERGTDSLSARGARRGPITITVLVLVEWYLYLAIHYELVAMIRYL